MLLSGLLLEHVGFGFVSGKARILQEAGILQEARAADTRFSGGLHLHSALIVHSHPLALFFLYASEKQCVCKH